MSDQEGEGLKPLVLLDLDGVINDLGAGGGRQRPWRLDTIEANGFTLLIPDYLPELIQNLTAVAEVWWCTTWLHDANAEVADHLGIDELPVIEADMGEAADDWKVAGSRALVADALAAGRPVYWIEDFGGTIPSLRMPDGVVFIDTAASEDRQVLRSADLPAALRGGQDDSPEPRDTDNQA